MAGYLLQEDGSRLTLEDESGDLLLSAVECRSTQVATLVLFDSPAIARTTQVATLVLFDDAARARATQVAVLVMTGPSIPDPNVCVYFGDSGIARLGYEITASFTGESTSSQGMYCGVRTNFPGHQIPYPCTIKMSEIYGATEKTLIVLKKSNSFFSLINDGSISGYPLYEEEDVVLQKGDYIYIEPSVSFTGSEKPDFTETVRIFLRFDTNTWPYVCDTLTTIVDPEEPQDPYDPSRPVRPINPLDPRQRVKPAGVLDPDVDLNAIERFRPLDPWESYLKNYRKGVKSSDGEVNPTKPLDWNKP